MGDHNVLIQNREESLEALSITGLVDGHQEAVVVLKGHIPKGLKGAALELFLMQALARAFEHRPPAPVVADAKRVSV